MKDFSEFDKINFKIKKTNDIIYSYEISRCFNQTLLITKVSDLL